MADLIEALRAAHSKAHAAWFADPLREDLRLKVLEALRQLHEARALEHAEGRS